MVAADGQTHALYHCRVFHARYRPFRHAFSYKVWSLLLDIDRLDDLPSPLTHNRPGLLSILDRDHGRRDGSPLRPWVEGVLADKGVHLSGGRILLFCFPRVLGYGFNPLSIFYGFGPDGDLRGVVYEVKNTFGDQHCYVIPTPNGLLNHAHAKEFHVSPFFDIEGGYRFRLSLPGDHIGIDIHYDDAAGPLLVATQTGQRRHLSTRSLWSALARHPLVTLKVIAGIHWEALKLWRKGAMFHRRPDPPVRLETLAERSARSISTTGQTMVEP
ncbi:hypothetical protein CHU95_13655 [Niveispirillum lacus]|uniref:DUF1365 domain-containing protein n=1 Tax=Niveispirillum lacus TaxID=1981099 RepID=A0A255YX98_9PROT|nr:DUF1365 domain-containing protein [Niveispirillum lacus]OYQ33801.1 hypothetical protein CHU95_13655 [Niveispirillum lacus]